MTRVHATDPVQIAVKLSCMPPMASWGSFPALEKPL